MNTKGDSWANAARLAGIASFVCSFGLLAVLAIAYLTRSEQLVRSAAYFGTGAYCLTFTTGVALIIAAAVKRSTKAALGRAYRWLTAGGVSFIIQALGIFAWAKITGAN